MLIYYGIFHLTIPSDMLYFYKYNSCIEDSAFSFFSNAFGKTTVLCSLKRVHFLTHFSFTVTLAYKILIKFSTEDKRTEVKCILICCHISIFIFVPNIRKIICAYFLVFSDSLRQVGSCELLSLCFLSCR